MVEGDIHCTQNTADVIDFISPLLILTSKVVTLLHGKQLQKYYAEKEMILSS